MLVKVDYRTATAPHLASRKDLQATKLFLVTVRPDQALTLDDEATAVEWKCLADLKVNPPRYPSFVVFVLLPKIIITSSLKLRSGSN